eukprot:340540-Pleurochrysis_carterae.AAC.1
MGEQKRKERGERTEVPLVELLAWKGGTMTGAAVGAYLITYQVREGKCACQSHFLHGHGRGRPER